MVVNLAISTAPLESGDRLTRKEFELRYTASEHIRKAELIEGVVYLASPVRATRHARPHGMVIILILKTHATVSVGCVAIKNLK